MGATVKAALFQTDWTEGRFVGDVGDPYRPELIVRELDIDKIKQVRDRWAFYRDRRPDAYGGLVAD